MAKVAAIASSLFGCVSEVPGLTLLLPGTHHPLMKNLGYKKEFAAGTESNIPEPNSAADYGGWGTVM